MTDETEYVVPTFCRLCGGECINSCDASDRDARVMTETDSVYWESGKPICHDCEERIMRDE